MAYGGGYSYDRGDGPVLAGLVCGAQTTLTRKARAALGWRGWLVQAEFDDFLEQKVLEFRVLHERV